MNILALTDIHMVRNLGDTLNKYRTNIYVDVYQKLQWISDTAVRTNVDVIVVAGDWFHNAKVSYEMQSLVADALSGYVPVLGVAGQHDVPNRGWWKCGPLYMLSCMEGFTIAGHDAYSYDTGCGLFLLVPFSRDPLLALEKHPNTDILVTHCMITNRQVDFEHVLIEDFYTQMPVKPKLVISGDFHPGFPPKRVEDTWFINPGTLTRQHPKNWKHIPQIAMVEFVEDVHSITYHPVEVAKPGDQVFDLERYRVDIEALVSLKERYKVNPSWFAEQVLSSLELSASWELDLEGLGLSDGAKEIINDALALAIQERDNES